MYVTVNVQIPNYQQAQVSQLTALMDSFNWQFHTITNDQNITHNQLYLNHFEDHPSPFSSRNRCLHKYRHRLHYAKTHTGSIVACFRYLILGRSLRATIGANFILLHRSSRTSALKAFLFGVKYFRFVCFPFLRLAFIVLFQATLHVALELVVAVSASGI